MGSWHRTFALRGDLREEVLYRLDGWLLAKGFERWGDPDAALLPPDERGERGAFLLGNGEWTVLAYSEVEEEERLELELVRLGRPVFRYLVVDSDVWAYQLRVGDDIVSAFASDRSIYSDLPEGPNDLDVLCRELELGADPKALRRLQRKRDTFAECVGGEFLAAIGLEAAGTRFEYLFRNEECGSGFEILELRYRRPGFDPMHELDLHRVEALPREVFEVPVQSDEEAPPFEIPAHLRLLVALARLQIWILRPIFWLARPLFLWRARRRLGPPADGAKAQLPAPPPPALTRVSPPGVFEHRELGFRLTLDDEAEIGGFHRLFRWRGLDVGVSILTATAARGVLSGAAAQDVVEKRDFFVGSLPARAWIAERSEPNGGLDRWWTLYLATRRGVYAFSGRGGDRTEPASVEALWQLLPVLSTFELCEIRRGSRS